MSTPLPLPNPPENVLFRLGQVGAHPLHLLADGAHLPLKVAAALTIPTRHLPALAAAAAAADAAAADAHAVNVRITCRPWRSFHRCRERWGRGRGDREAGLPG